MNLYQSSTSHHGPQHWNVVQCPKASASSAHGSREEQGSQLVTVFCSVFCWSHVHCYPGLCLHRCFFLISDLNSKFAISFASCSVCYCGTWPIVNMSNKHRRCYEFLFLSQKLRPATCSAHPCSYPDTKTDPADRMESAREQIICSNSSGLPCSLTGTPSFPTFSPVHGE